jgi:16S rRNA (uracil1498-N3)-methyltransferase
MSRKIRAFVDESIEEIGQEVLLTAEESVHLSRVLRLRPGNLAELLDGRGGCFSAECLEVNRSEVRLVVRSMDSFPPSQMGVRMCIALTKGGKWEELIRPLTELGVHRLTPILTERAEGSFSEKKLEERKSRWSRLAREACKQSGNPWLPIFDDPVDLRQLLSSEEEGESRWMGSLNQTVRGLNPPSDARLISILIGPEGGWSPAEEEFAQEKEISFFRMADHVLRMDTAAISALAVARARLFC